MSKVIVAHASQDCIPSESSNSISTAYGLRKCPKLIELVQQSDPEVQLNSLTTIVDNISNPESMGQFCKLGLISILFRFLDSTDNRIKINAVRALKLSSYDSNGKLSMLASGQLDKLGILLINPDFEVRFDSMTILLNMSISNGNGTRLLASMNYVVQCINAITEESDMEMKKISLRALRQLCSCDKGISDALKNKAVICCLNVLQSNLGENGSLTNDELCSTALDTLSYICFSDLGKQQAIALHAVEQLCSLLAPLYSSHASVQGSAIMALCSLCTEDEGKLIFARQENAAQNTISIILFQLNDWRGKGNSSLLLNCLKLVSIVSVHPQTRRVLSSNADLVHGLDLMLGDVGSMISRHAQIAKEAVLWEA